MRLNKIILDGFKSFADKTEFVFGSSVTAIVGPNGCGKSNIVDAVKWVLGEQSVKSLRSDQMADVIFSGSGSRKPLGTAQVSLCISNTNGTGTRQLPIDTDEIQVSRRIFKSGESEYRMNNKICRLKDVRELFMDTGIGTRAYSILEQGQIEQLVSASKIDRRVIFEEAAGISKYKAHKKEALRRLEQTEQNLLRLADILGEVAKSLRSVKLQAGKARSYLEYTQRLKQLQVNYSLVEYAKNHSQIVEKTSALSQAQDQFERLIAFEATQEAQMSRLGEQIIEGEHKLNLTNNALVSVESKIEQQLQRIEFLRTRISELQQRGESASQKIGKLLEQKNLFASNLAQYENEMTGCRKMLEEKTGSIEEIQKAIQQINGECVSLEAELEDEKSGIIDIVRRTAQLHNEIQSISVYRNNLSSQKERLAGRAETAKAELEKLLTEKAQHKARLSDIEKVLNELQENLDSKVVESEEIESLIAADGKRLAHSKEARSALSGELAILMEMENRLEGLKAGVKSILQNRSLGNIKLEGIEGILADIIAADLEYANAVEAALEGQTDTLVIAAAADLLSNNELIEKLDGRVNFLCLDKIEPFVDATDLSGLPDVKGRLAEFVTYSGKYAPLVWKLLGKVVLVDSLDAAAKLADELGDGYKFVTLKGEFLSGDGLIKLGPLGRATGLISRKSRLRQLQETIANITSEIGGLESQIDKNGQTQTHLAKLCKELRTAFYEASTQKMQVDSQLTVIEQNIKRLKEEEPLIATEMGSLEDQIAMSVQREYQSKQQLEELEAVNEQRTARIQELEAKFAGQRERQQSLTDTLTDLKVALGQVTEQTKALNQLTASIRAQIQENHTAIETAQAEMQNCSKQFDETQSDILGCEAAVSELFVGKEKNQQGKSVV